MVVPMKQDSEMGLPVGVRFHPRDHELVDYYLYRRIVIGDSFHSHFVFDSPDFFDDDPWIVWQLYSPDDNDDMDEERLYFFTHRTKLSSTAKRFNRKVGSGTWSNMYSKNIVDPNNKSLPIGIKREFRYEGGCHSGHNNAWLMQEYQVIDDDSDIVLCTLRKNPRKAPPAHFHTAVEQSTTVNHRKRKNIVNQPQKPKVVKRQKKESIAYQSRKLEMKKQKKEEDFDKEEQELQDSAVKVEDTNCDQQHQRVLEVVIPFSSHDDQESCYHPELYPAELVHDDNSPDFSTLFGKNFNSVSDSDTFIDSFL